MNGRAGKENLSPNRMEELKAAVLNQYPAEGETEKTAWADCVRAIDAAGRKLTGLNYNIIQPVYVLLLYRLILSLTCTNVHGLVVIEAHSDLATTYGEIADGSAVRTIISKCARIIPSGKRCYKIRGSARARSRAPHATFSRIDGSPAAGFPQIPFTFPLCCTV